MIADLIRAFIEAVVAREVNHRLPPGVHIDRLYLAGDPSRLMCDWSRA